MTDAKAPVVLSEEVVDRLEDLDPGGPLPSEDRDGPLGAENRPLAPDRPLPPRSAGGGITTEAPAHSDGPESIVERDGTVVGEWVRGDQPTQGASAPESDEALAARYDEDIRSAVREVAEIAGVAHPEHGIGQNLVAIRRAIEQRRLGPEWKLERAWRLRMAAGSSCLAVGVERIPEGWMLTHIASARFRSLDAVAYAALAEAEVLARKKLAELAPQLRVAQELNAILERKP